MGKIAQIAIHRVKDVLDQRPLPVLNAIQTRCGLTLLAIQFVQADITKMDLIARNAILLARNVRDLGHQIALIAIPLKDGLSINVLKTAHQAT